MKVFVEVSAVAATAGRSELSEYVAPLEDAGATGVTVSDHLFYTRDGLPRSSGVRPACDPLTTLASVAALSDRLELQTVVVNTAWIHPALLLLRQFTQLAVLAGGERVTAGLGAGWSPEEFAAQGLQMPPFRQRMERLEEVLALAPAVRHRLGQHGGHLPRGRRPDALPRPGPGSTAARRRWVGPRAAHGRVLNRRPRPAR